MGGLFYFSKGLGLPGIGPHLDFSSLMISLRTARSLANVSFSLLICYFFFFAFIFYFIFIFLFVVNFVIH